MSLDGDVTALRGGCPSVSFAVQGQPVTTTAATTYKKGTCASLRNGERVKLSGSRRGNEPIVATRIDIKKGNGNGDDDDDDEDDD